MDVETGIERQVTEDGYVWALVWSPDGGSIAYATDVGGLEVLILDLVSGVERQMTYDSDMEDVVGLVWSPDGGSVAFSGYVWGHLDWKTFVIDVDTDVVELVDNTNDDLGPVWSPDSACVAYTSNRDGDWDVYILDLATGVELQITDNTDLDVATDWAL